MITLIPAVSEINTIDDVKNFFQELFNNGEEFHPEDDPKELIKGSTGQPLFNPEEAVKMEEALGRVWEVCNIEGSDPCQILCDIVGHIIED